MEVVIDFCPGIGIQLMMGRSLPILELFGMDGWRTCHPHSHSFLVLGITVARHCFCPILIWFVDFRSGSSGSVGRGLGRLKLLFLYQMNFLTMNLMNGNGQELSTWSPIRV